MAGTGGVGFRTPAASPDEATSASDDAPTNEAEPLTGEASPARRRRLPESRWRTVLVVGGLAAVVVIPMVVALGVLRDPRWLPLSDVAQIEMRVRDVGFDHPPLLGLGGRLQGYGEVGSHPGPLSFYALAPAYRLFGSDGFGLQVAATALSLTAAGLSIWLGYRRGGWRFALAVTVALGLLMRTYGAWRLAEAWNPHLPVMWWFLFLMAVWSVLCDDWPILPLAVFAGCYCAQTHIPYVGPVVGLGGLTAVALAVRWWSLRSEPEPRRRLLRWAGVSAGLVALFWLPPVIEQLRNDPGNLSIIVENFRNPYDKKLAFGDAYAQWIRRLDITTLFTSDRNPAPATRGLHPLGQEFNGIVCLVIWAATAALAVVRRDQALVRLHALVGASVLIGLVSISRIFGPPWPYLMLWMWGVTALMTLAMGWTLLSVAFRPRPAPDLARHGLGVADPTWPAPSVAMLGVGALVVGVVFSVDAAYNEMPAEQQSRQLAALVGPAIPVLEDDPAGCGDDCRYLVTWSDPYNIGAQGFGLLAELEGRGFEARALPFQEVGVRSHRLTLREDADAVVTLAVGGDAIEQLRAQPDVRELAFDDPNSESAREDYMQLRRDLAEQLEVEGYHDLAVRAENSPYSVIPLDPDMSQNLTLMLYVGNQYEKPAALFLTVQ